jgi:nitroreductase
MSQHPYHPIPYPFKHRDGRQILRHARHFCQLMEQRRSIRFFSDEPVPHACIELAIQTASSAPSGAHRQPWTFVAVDDPALKREIREAAEAEERQNYEGGRLSEDWLTALAPFGTDWHKPFLETAPYLVICFRQNYGLRENGEPVKHYYVHESVGIACGLFIAAIHYMGLVTLTHTPNPMAFLSRILNRPENEKPFILFPVGYPAPDATVPNLRRKTIQQVLQWNRGGL